MIVLYSIYYIHVPYRYTGIIHVLNEMYIYLLYSTYCTVHVLVSDDCTAHTVHVLVSGDCTAHTVHVVSGDCTAHIHVHVVHVY